MLRLRNGVSYLLSRSSLDFLEDFFFSGKVMPLKWKLWMLLVRDLYLYLPPLFAGEVSA